MLVLHVLHEEKECPGSVISKVWELSRYKSGILRPFRDHKAPLRDLKAPQSPNTEAEVCMVGSWLCAYR